MGVMDAFAKEDRLEITVSQLIKLIDDRAKAESAFYNSMAMLREGVNPETVQAVFDMNKTKGGQSK